MILPQLLLHRLAPVDIGFHLHLLQLVDSNLLRVRGPNFSHAFPGRSCLPLLSSDLKCWTKTDANRNEKMRVLAEDIPLKGKLQGELYGVTKLPIPFWRDSPYYKLSFGVRSCDVDLIHPEV